MAVTIDKILGDALMHSHGVDDVDLTGLTTASIADSTDKRYVTDAQRTVISNTSGTNTGDQNLSGYQLTSQKSQANGYASLGSDGKVPTSELNPIAITSTFVVNSQAAQLALTAQEGDVAVRTDLSKTYIHNGGTAGTMADWTEMLTPTDAVLSVDGQTGTVILSSSYEPKNANIQSHIASTSNPHATTAQQVGAVDKTGDTMTGQLNATAVEIGEKSPGYFNVITNGTPYIYRANTNLTDDTPLFVLRRAKGSIASPTAVESGYGLGTFEVGAHDGTKYTSGWNGGAGFSAMATENWTSTTHGTKLVFQTTNNGSANWSQKMTLSDDGKLGIGVSSPTEAIDVSGNILSDGKVTATDDLYGASAGIGIGTKLHKSYGGILTHFTSASLPTGFSWAGSPFATPSTVNNNLYSDYLRLVQSSSTPTRHFLCKTISNSASSWQNRWIKGRFIAGGKVEIGFRVDDGTDNTYAELFVNGAASDGTCTVTFRQRLGGGAVTTTSVPTTFLANTAVELQLLSYWSGSYYAFYGYLLSETGLGVNVSGFNTASLSGIPATGRVGVHFANTGLANPGFVDWINTTF